MCASYFIILFKLFVDNYYLKPKGIKRQHSVREVVRSMSRQITQTLEVEAEGAEEAETKLN